MELKIDEVAQARIDRVRQHLPAGNDLTLVTLKGHLLVEEALDEIIAIACSEPKHLENQNLPFRFKPLLARALFGHLLWPALWPLVEALNAVRNNLAHHLDSPELQQRVIRFLNVRMKHAQLLHDPPIVPSDPSAIAEQFRADVSLLISQLTGGALFVRTVTKQAQPAVPADPLQRASPASAGL